MYSFFFLVERAHQQWGQGHREKERENLKEAAFPVQSLMWGSISQP